MNQKVRVMKNNIKSNPELAGYNIKQIKSDIKKLRKGEDMSNTRKISIVRYLSKKGQTVEQISQIFEKLPDYNKDVIKSQMDYVLINLDRGT